jgi:hypothetical protein
MPVRRRGMDIRCGVSVRPASRHFRRPSTLSAHTVDVRTAAPTAPAGYCESSCEVMPRLISPSRCAKMCARGPRTLRLQLTAPRVSAYARPVPHWLLLAIMAILIPADAARAGTGKWWQSEAVQHELQLARSRSRQSSRSSSRRCLSGGRCAISSIVSRRTGSERSSTR